MENTLYYNLNESIKRMPMLTSSAVSGNITYTDNNTTTSWIYSSGSVETANTWVSSPNVTGYYGGTTSQSIDNGALILSELFYRLLRIGIKAVKMSEYLKE